MFWTLVVMLGIVAIAGVVVVYVAYPYRGEDVPHTPWLGDAMRRSVKALPTLDNQREQEPVDVGSPHADR